jgi:hypothetical protein
MFPVANVTPTPSVGPEPPGLMASALQAFGLGPKPAAAAPPDPYTDDTDLLKTYAAASRRCNEKRVAFERVWWRLLLYLLGRQWIYFERSANQWVDKRLQRWIPRPVTNKIATTLNTILSVFQSVNLAVSCRPEGNAPNDIMAADTANKYEAPLRADHDWARVQDDADWWLTALGNVGLCTWWDYSGDSTSKFVEWEQCAACGKVFSPVAVKAAGDVCPECQNPILKAAVDEQGQPIGQTFQSGHGRTDVVSPLEFSFPPTFTNPDDSDVIIRRRWRAKEYYEDRLPASMLDKIKWENMATERSLQMLRALASSTEISSAPNSMGGAGGDSGECLGTSEAELWMKPCKKYPKGLVLRVVDTTDDGDGIVLRLENEGLPGPLPDTAPDGRRTWPWIFIGYEKFGGRGWCRSPLEHLIEKQNQLNQIDSMMQMIIQRMANPVWLEPKGSEVTKFSGEPGLVVKYNAMAGGGNAKPERIEGANVPSSLPAIREMILSDIEDLAGTHDILKGSKPAGVEAFSAMQLLVERSQSRYGKVLEARGIAYRRWFKIALDMERKLGPEERAIAILGPNGGYTRESFKKAQLDGSIRIEVEDGSQMPKTALGNRAAVQQLQALGVIDTKNPETSYSILQLFGQTQLYPGLDAQVMGARRVQQAFEQWAAVVQFVAQPPATIAGPTGALVTDPITNAPMTQPQPPAPSTPPPGQIKPWMNSNVYLAEHMKWASGDIVQKLIVDRPEIEPFVEMLILQHQQQVAIEQAAQQQPQDPNGKDGKGVGGGRAMTNSNQESGKPGVNTGAANAA